MELITALLTSRLTGPLAEPVRGEAGLSLFLTVWVRVTTLSDPQILEPIHIHIYKTVGTTDL